MENIKSYNPANKELLAETPTTSKEEILSCVLKARSANKLWSEIDINERLLYVEAFRKALASEQDRISKLITWQIGKPYLEALVAEVFNILETCKWLERKARYILKPKPVEANQLLFHGKSSYNIYEPLGVVAVISPWNYPFAIPVATMLFALVAGNAVVLKPSPKASLVGDAIAKLFGQAGFPENLVNVVQGGNLEAEYLIGAGINRVMFTGSVSGGRAIMSLAAKQLIPVTLELGGKHAAIVLEDADLEATAPAIVWGAFTNAGQACASIDRVLVVEPLAGRLLDKISQLTRKLRLGTGLDLNSDVGPLIDAQQLARVQNLVNQAESSGAVIVVGGRSREDLGGYFFEPTVLANIHESMQVMQEEIFGPVLPVVKVSDSEEAVKLANASNFGLASSIWTSNIVRGKRLAHKLEAGIVWINDCLYSHACPDAPWGGIKNSGFGRMHGAPELLDLVYIKNIGVGLPRQQGWQFPYHQERLKWLQAALALIHNDSFTAKLKAIPIALFARIKGLI